MKFYVVKVPSANNVIFDRTTLTELRAVISIQRLKMKFLIEFGIGVVSGC